MNPVQLAVAAYFNRLSDTFGYGLLTLKGIQDGTNLTLYDLAPVLREFQDKGYLDVLGELTQENLENRIINLKTIIPMDK